ncbi:putative membrane protein [Bifidobacterium subtile]|jgi:membrane protein DedA with SNARE-associated domain|uniref:Putative membrane protein n=2 Tax=Bifidobacterium subtile TaxID=77635 RepID=A0A087EB31_9BIFI|nr:DedA family protein [Bifidobacterium subtile]KFJ04982.1 putative membrane protein [Bifidobacterium subtile]QOL37109.1 DedA family protein [Bifidobacterium subtile]
MAGMHITVLANAIASCPTASGGLIGTLTGWLVSLMDAVGGIGVAAAIALESIFPPIPSEVILPLAGFTAARGSMGLVEAIVWASIGSLLGAWTLYGVSRLVGIVRIRRAADAIPGVSRADVDKANDWFTRYGTWSVLFGRVIPVVRSLISIPAGFNGMSFLQFSGWTLLGSAIWNSVLVGAGYLLGDQWCAILGVLGVAEDIVIALFVVAIIVLLARWMRNLVVSKRREENEQ